MEKEIESLKSSANTFDDKKIAATAEEDDEHVKTVKHIDGKELIKLFQNMSVTKTLWKSPTKPAIHQIRKTSKLKKKKVPKKSTSPLSDSSKKSPSTETRFSEFSADCSRELETIVKEETSNKNPSVKQSTEDKSCQPRILKKRKTSSCAQQARNECHPLTNTDAVNFSIDLLTDYLDEAILFPKKMSYMAELMYT